MRETAAQRCGGASWSAAAGPFGDSSALIATGAFDRAEIRAVAVREAPDLAAKLDVNVRAEAHRTWAAATAADSGAGEGLPRLGEVKLTPPPVPS